MGTVRTTTVQDTQTRRDQTAEGGSRQRGHHVKSELSTQAQLNSTFREGSSGRRLPKDLLLLSPPRRPAQDEMRHIIGSSEPAVIIGSDRDRNRECRKKDRDHTEFLCELYEAQAAQGRYFVHELTPEVNSRMKCVAKIVAMPGTRRAVADLCMFGLAACDERGPGFVNISVRTVANARRVGVRLQSKYASTHRHARVDCDNPTEKGENGIMGSPSRSSNGGTSFLRISRSWRRVKRKGTWKMRRQYARLFVKTTRAKT